MSSKILNIFMVLLAFVLPLSIALVNIVSAIIILVWILEGNIKHKILAVSRNKMLIIPFVFPLLFIISGLWSETLIDSYLIDGKKLYIYGIMNFIWIPIIPIILVTSIEKKYLTLSITAFLSGMFISEIVSYLIFFNLINFEILQAYGLIYHFASSSNPTPFLSSIHYSFFLGITILLLLEQFKDSKVFLFRFFIIVFIISATSNLFINGGRTGQIGIIFSIITYSVFIYIKNIKKIFFSCIAIMSILFVAYNFSPVFKERIYFAKSDINKVVNSDYNSSWGVRIASNKIASEYFFNSPENFLLGAGSGGAKKTFNDFAKENMPVSISEPVLTLHHLHNQYFQLWIDGGILALVALIFYFYIMKKETVFDKNNAFIVAIIVFYIFTFGTNSFFLKTQSYLLFLFIGGYLLALKNFQIAKSEILK